MEDVPDEEIKQAMHQGDIDENGKLSYEEFMRIVSMKKGFPEDSEAKLNWYWDHFAHD
jgi:Ca2+-binding EF-hand superfamily protein